MHCHKFTRSLPACLPPVSLSLPVSPVRLSPSVWRALSLVCLWLYPLVFRKPTPNVWLVGLLGRKIETGGSLSEGQAAAGSRAARPGVAEEHPGRREPWVSDGSTSGLLVGASWRPGDSQPCVINLPQLLCPVHLS